MGGKMPCKSILYFSVTTASPASGRKSLGRNGTHLDEHTQLIPVVPRFHHLSVHKSLHAHALRRNLLSRRCNSLEVARVARGKAPARHHELAFFDGVMDLDVNRGECLTHAVPEFLEAFRSYDVGRIDGLAVANRVFRTKFVDGSFALLIPDLFKP